MPFSATFCQAMQNVAEKGIELWDPTDGFYYDVLHLPDGRHFPLKIRSMVGLIPLFAVATLEANMVDNLPGFKRRMQWFIEHRPELSEHIETETTSESVRRFLSLVNRRQLRLVLRYMLDEVEFFSPYGIRALSRFHKDHPYSLRM